MNDDFYRGRTFGYAFYLIGIVNSIIAAHFTDTLSREMLIAICLILLASIIGYAVLRRKASQNFYKHYQLITYQLLGIFMAYCFNSVPLFFFGIMLHNVLSILYMDNKLEHSQLLISMAFMAAAGIWGFPGLEMLPPPLYFFYTITVAGAHWMCISILSSIDQRDRINKEQEKSLDDMLKVIEVKCDEAREATKSKSDFLSNMSHEIRTPLNSVLGMNELILRETNDSNIREYANNVETSGRLLLSLINDILDFSKIESGKMDIIPVKYQLSSLINDTVNMLSKRFEEKGLELEIKINKDIPNGLKGDEVRIRQILTNIMTNALKYTDKGYVTLTADYEKTSDNSIILILSVKDTGRGIKPEDKEKLFMSFSRVDQKKNRNIEGTGLGLSITNSLINAMKGKISVESLYGSGSVFTVRIPQPVVDTTPIGDFSSQIEERSEGRRYHESFTAPDAKVLVTDDNKANLLVAKGLMKNTLIQVDTAVNGIECIEKLRKSRYDVLLLDHMMPEMDGIETLNIIREEGLADGMPVVALTANAISGAREMYIEHGFTDYLSKPIAGKNLEKMLVKLLPPELVHKTSPGKEENVAPVPVKEAPEAAPKPEKLIDHDIAMKYVDGSDELYMILLQTYIEQGPEYLEKLETYYKEGDIHNYRIVAHSVKSTSLNIGAKDLSERAKKHEFAAKENDSDTIAADVEGFLIDYRNVLKEAEVTLAEVEKSLGM